jgi:hypothetical protein
MENLKIKINGVAFKVSNFALSEDGKLTHITFYTSKGETATIFKDVQDGTWSSAGSEVKKEVELFIQKNI